MCAVLTYCPVAAGVTIDYAPSPQHPLIYTNALIHCEASAMPQPEVSWKFQGRHINGQFALLSLNRLNSLNYTALHCIQNYLKWPKYKKLQGPLWQTAVIYMTNIHYCSKIIGDALVFAHMYILLNCYLFFLFFFVFFHLFINS